MRVSIAKELQQSMAEEMTRVDDDLTADIRVVGQKEDKGTLGKGGQGENPVDKSLGLKDGRKSGLHWASASTQIFLLLHD